jgi:hypothetical protein
MGMLIGYNPKYYIRTFCNDLKNDCLHNQINIDIECVDEHKDIYRIKEQDKVYNLEIDEIVQEDIGSYQILKMTYREKGKIYNMLTHHDDVNVRKENDGELYFSIISDVI